MLGKFLTKPFIGAYNRMALGLGIAAVVALLGIQPGDASALTRWQRSLRAIVKTDAKVKRALGKKCHARSMSAKATSYCDMDGDGFVNFRERNFPRLNGKRLRTNFRKIDTDGDGLTDYEELLRYGTNPQRADSDADGLSDGDEVNVYGTDPLKLDSDGNGIPDGQQILSNQNGGGCTPPNFDGAGNTTQFGIPAGIIGNKSRGQTVHTNRCQVCHPLGDHGINLSYQQLDSAITGATGKPMNIHLQTQDLADLAAWLNRSQLGGTGNCPTPTPPSSTPTPEPTATSTPTPSPTATPCPGGGSQNFDVDGNTTAFGIPTPIVGNIAAGNTQYHSTCTACHLPASGERGGGYDFSQLKSAFQNNPFMNGSLSGPVVLNDQQIAHVIAYVRRNETGGCGAGPTPTPVATPDAVSQGAAIFTATCAQCHSINAQGRPRNMDRHPSKNQIHEALWTGPDEMPQFRDLTLGQSAPPYSVSELALWSYLNSLP